MGSILDMLVSSYQIVNNDSFDVICDVERRIKFVGTGLLNVFNLKHVDVIGYRLDEIVSPVRSLAERYSKLNNDLISGKLSERNYVSVISQEDNGIIIIKNIAKPIKVAGSIIGLHIHTQIVEPFSVIGSSIAFDLLNLDANEDFNGVVQLPNASNADYKLSELHELVIYLVVVGRSDKDIMLIINKLTGKDYSQQFVSKILTRHLFPKFNVINRRELVEKVLQLNVISQIPRMLLVNHNNFRIVLS